MFNNWLFIMKRFILWVLIIIFGVIPSFFLNNIALASDENPTTIWDIWLKLDESCLMWMWKWCMDTDRIIWIERERAWNITPKSIAQDVILAATYMVWTVLTLVIIYCGLMYIFAARDGKDTSKYKKWLINSAIWALLVLWAYSIVRLIQYIAKW